VRARARPLAFAVAIALLIGFTTHSQNAHATIQPAVTIDGPSEDVVGFGGVAMAEDGSGGVVYLKRVGGVAHVFVARYLDGHWLAPIQADAGQPYVASWPRIAAADGGELVVVWVTPFATEGGRPVQELLGATLDQGASAFGPAMMVDADIETGTGASPDLAMSSTGQADVVYRVVHEETGRTTSIPLLRPGDVIEDVRVAHFNGETWSSLGTINRNPGISMRPATQTNGPQIAVGPTGNGIVVWQEPNVDGTARIWARRIFGHTLGYVMPVSAESLGGAPLSGDADAPSVAFSILGQAEVAYRQAAAPGSPLAGPRIFLNTLPDGESLKASGTEFLGASIADPTPPPGAGGAIGPPSVDVDSHREVRLLYDAGGTPRVIEGGGAGLASAISLGPPYSPGEVMPASVMNPAGGGVSAWPSTEPGGEPAVALREDFPSGAVQTGLVSGAGGGPIGELGVGRSGLGDGIVAFQQGPLGDAAIVAAHASAPPAELAVSAPNGWVRPAKAEVSWEPARSADGPLGYRVVLDGRPIAAPAGTSSMRISPRGLDDGVHEVRLLAGDADGQETLSAPVELRVDGHPPTVAVRAGRGGTVRVSVRDRASGVAVGAVRIRFGDGRGARARRLFTHRYARAGVYSIAVWVRDRAGNRAVVRRLVSVR
jgi:hypothetical protein